MSHYYHKSVMARQSDERVASLINLIVVTLALPILPACWLLIARVFIGI